MIKLTDKEWSLICNALRNHADSTMGVRNTYRDQTPAGVHAAFDEQEAAERALADKIAAERLT